MGDFTKRRVVAATLTALMAVNSFGITPAWAENIPTANFAGNILTFAQVAKNSSLTSGMPEVTDRTFTVDGLTYRVISEEERTVQLGDGENKNTTFSGALEIPRQVNDGSNDYTVMAVGNNAFSANANITALTIPDTVTAIGSRAFDSIGAEMDDNGSQVVVNAIEEVVLPDSVTFLGEGAFSGSAVESLVFSAGLTEIPARCFNITPSLTSVTIPEGIENIGEQAFNMCTSLSSVHIPASVASIGNQCFWSCDSLRTVSFAEDSQLEEIGERAFQFDTALKSINLPSSLQTIGAQAFANCSLLDDIGLNETSQLTVLGDSAFSNTALTSFYIPETLTSIGEKPLASCSKLEEINVAADNSVYSSEDGVWFDKGKTRLIQYPAGKKKVLEYTTPSSVTTVDPYAFAGAKYLMTVNISDGVETLGGFLFQGCQLLDEVNIADSVESMGRLSFYQCPSLTTVTLPAGLTNVPDNFFYTCESLESITFPAGIKTIEAGAVGDCIALTEIILLSPVLDAVENGAFSSVSSGVQFTVETDAIKEQLVTSGVAAENITSLGKDPAPPAAESFTKDGLYYKVLSQATEEQPGTVQVGDGGYGSCEVSYGAAITIPETVENEGLTYTVTAIAENTFSTTLGASSPKSVVIPKTVTQIGANAFYECSSLENVTFAAGSALESIGANAFDSCSFLQAITLPDTVKTIGEKAFYNCKYLKDVTWSTSLTSLEDGAFSGTKIETITLPASLTKLNGRPFDNCASLKSVTVAADNANYTSEDGVLFNKAKTTLLLYPAAKVAFEYDTPNGLLEIADYAFANASLLETVRINEGVEKVGSYVFQKASALETVEIADSVKSIGRLAFYNCNSLANVKLSASLTTLPSNLFYSCPMLETLTLPVGVRNIESGIFGSCPSLNAITIEVTSPSLTVASGAFSSLDDTTFTVRTQDVKDKLVVSGVAEEKIVVEGSGIIEPDESFTQEGITYQVLTQPEGDTLGTLQVGDGKTALSLSGEVVIPATVANGPFQYQVTVLGENALNGAEELTALTLPEGLTEIGDSAISGTGLTAITIPKTVEKIGVNAISGNYSLKSIQFEPGGALVELGNGALCDNTYLETITNLPKTLTTLGIRTMGWNYHLTTVTFEPGSALTDIGEGTFFRAEELTALTLPAGVTVIGKEAFYNCNKLATFQFENQVTSKEAGVDLSRITSIGENAFYHCAALQGKLTLSEQLIELPGGAFAGCTGFTTVLLPESITTLGEVTGGTEEEVLGVFEGCAGLQKIVLPESVNSIGKNTFKDCSSVTEVVIASPKLSGLGANSFHGLAENAIFRVQSDEVAKKLQTTSGIQEAAIVNYSAINALIEQAEGYKSSHYTAKTYATLQEALTAAKETVVKETSLQADLDAAAEKLSDAIDGLKRRSSGGGSLVVTEEEKNNNSSAEKPVIATSSHGEVGFSPSDPEAGDTVTVKITPDDGYTITEVTVTDADGKAVEVNKQEDGSYTFTQPAGQAKVNVSYQASGQKALPFSDVKNSDWFYSAVNFIYQEGLMDGVSATSFAPQDSTSRAMLVTVLWRLSGSPAASDSSFHDVTTGAWYATAAAWAQETGVVNGLTETTFGPNNALTREQLASILWRYAKSEGLDITSGAATSLAAYSDAAKVSAYAADALKWACGNGIINGMGDNTLAPAGNASRAETAAMLQRFLELYESLLP